MKIIEYYFILICVILFVGCKNHTASIEGIIDKNVQILYSNPNVSVCSELFLDTTMSDGNGKFQIDIDTKSPRFILIKIPNKETKYYIPVVPGEKNQISFNKEGTLTVQGPNKAGIELYQSVLQYEPFNMEWKKFSNIPVEKRDSTIEQIKNKELEPFNKLLDQKKISKSFYQLIETDRNTFYAFVRTWLYSWDYMKLCRNSESDKDTLSKNTVIIKLNSIYSKYKPNDIQTMKSPVWDTYADFLYLKVFQQFKFTNLDKNNIEQLLSIDHIPFWYSKIKTGFSGKCLESELAIFIEDGDIADNPKTYISAYNFFKEQFPLSGYLKYFQSRMNEAVSFYDNKKIDENIHFIQNSDSINTFDELISLFKGKKLYIDIWGTDCGPCRHEMKFESSIEKLIKENNIIQLYIALGSKPQDETWKTIINANDLKGYHIMANKALENNIKESIYKNKQAMIPRYLYIDENGKIINDNAPRPSNYSELGKLFEK